MKTWVLWLAAACAISACNDGSLYGGGADIDVTPMSLDFGVPVPDSPTSKPVTIANRGAEPLRVDGIELAAGTDPVYSVLIEDEVAFPVELGPNDSLTVQVTYDAPTPVIQTGTLLVHSSDPDESTVEVSLIGGDASLPDILVEPEMLDFGDVARLTCKSLPLDVRNVGSTDLTLTEMNVTVFGFGNDYTVSPQAFVVPPGASQNVTVEYCPSLTGVQLGQIEIVSDDPDENPVIVSLIGNGTPPPVAATDIHLRLTWDEAQTDLDLHLLRPSGVLYNPASDCFWNSTHPDWGVIGDPLDDPYLDVDDTNGFGPENINQGNPETGDYKVVVHYYGLNGTVVDNGPSNVTLDIHLNGSPTPTASYTTTITHLQTWNVAWIHWDATAGTGTVETIDTFGTYTPGG